MTDAPTRGPRRALWHPPLWIDALVAFGVSRAIIAVIGVIGASTFLDQHTMTTLGRDALHLGRVWDKWDVVWYERIAIHGYTWDTNNQTGQAVAGFFPLYPLTVGWLMRALPGISFFALGSALSNLLALVALLLIVQVLADDDAHARRVTMIFATAAGSFYLSLPYTESLFLLFVALVMIVTRRRQYLIAGGLSGLGAVTRIHGVGLVLIPLVAGFKDRTRPTSIRYASLALMVTLAAMPLCVFMAHLMFAQGSATAFVARQALWDNAFPYPLKAIVGFAVFPQRVSGWVHGAFWFLYIGLLVRYWRQMAAGEAWFVAAAMLISTQQETFHGIYRYVLPLVPLALALGRDRPAVRFTIIAINLVMGAIMILAFVTNNRLTV